MNDDIIELLKKHTLTLLTQENLFKYKNGHTLLADTIFDYDENIFINLHFPLPNDSTNKFHDHDFFEINYVIKGSCKQYIKGTSAKNLNEGNLCIVSPNVSHNLIATKDDLILNILMKKKLFSVTFWSLIGEQEHLGSFFLNFFLNQDNTSHHIIFRTQKTQTITNLLESICLEYLNKKPYYKISLECLLSLFFTEIVRINDTTSSKKNMSSKTTKQIQDIFNYLSENYAQATLQSTADHFHYHPNYFSAFVKKHTGKTFNAILNEIKLTQATYYLLNTNVSIKDISELLGFSDLPNFYTFIKKNCHTTPSNFRKLK